MATRSFSFAYGEYYHIYNRGTDKREIFSSLDDYRRFMQLLFLSNSSVHVHVREIVKSTDSVYEFERENEQVAIGAYCLMPNHFHLLVTPLQEQGVQTFMQKITTSYSMYYNRRHERTGSLFQGNYKAKHADTDEYLRYLYAYIHLNPRKLFDTSSEHVSANVNDTFLDKIAHYEYSSLQDYLIGSREEFKILKPESFPGYFSNAKAHLNELSDWLNFKPIPG